MGGRRLVVPLVAALLAVAGCAASDDRYDEQGLPAGQVPPAPAVTDPDPDQTGDAGEPEAEAGGGLAWAGYDAAFGVTSSQSLGTPEPGVSYQVRAACLAEVAVDLWFEVAVDQLPTAQGVFGCTGSEVITPLGELPEGATVTVQITGEVELISAASVVVVPDGG